jgi:hypothetical protein
MKDNIKVDLPEIGWDSMDWIGLVQDTAYWRALVKNVMKFRIQKIMRNSRVAERMPFLTKRSAP